MKKLLFIYNNPLDGSYGGSQRTRQALDGLRQNFEVLEYSCIKKANRIITLLRNILGYSGNLSFIDCKKILNQLDKSNIDCVFFDVSLHGRLVHQIKRHYPNIKVIVNYHNCEAQYFSDMFKTKGVLYYPIYNAAIKNENLSKIYADYHILITEEDRVQLGINNNFQIIPATLKDSYSHLIEIETNDSYLLFVGAAVYANIEGAKYIIEKLAPTSDKKFLIVGKGMKRTFPGDYKNVEIRDFVPSLATIYNNASAFICPLFYGSGAKIKVAEALMYGKKIIGSPLSFFGYNLENANYTVCSSESEFIEEIKKVDMNMHFYKENRNIFLSKYDSLNNSRYYELLAKALY